MLVIVRKTLKWLCISLLGLIILLALFVAGVRYLFKDRLIKYAVEEVNKQVDTRIDVRKIDFTFWQTFPNASVSFENVLINSSKKYCQAYQISASDTLVAAKAIYLEFSIWDVIRSDFRLKQITVTNGFVNVVYAPEGLSNYEILKEKKQGTTNVKFELKHLLIKNSVFKYRAVNNNFSAGSYIRKFSLKTVGKSTLSKYDINIDLNNNKIIFNKDYSTLIKSIKVSCSLINNEVISINNANIELNSMSYLLSGIINAGKQPRIDLQISGNDNKISDLQSLLPASVASKFSGYEMSGIFSVNIGLKGPLSDGPLALTGSLAISDGYVLHKQSKLALEQIKTKITFSTTSCNLLETYKIKIDKFNTLLGDGQIELDGSLQNLSKPIIQSNVSYKLKLNDLKTFFNLDTLEILEGSADCHAQVNGTLPSLSTISADDLLRLNYSGSLVLADADLKLKGNDYRFEQANGTITLGNDLQLKDIKCVVHGNDYLVNGTMYGFGPYVRKENPDMNLRAEITSRNLDLTKYFVSGTPASSDEISRELLFPEHVNCELTLHVNKFKLHSFNCKWINAKISYKPRMFIVQSLSFEAFNGRVSGNGAILQDMSNNFSVRGQLDLGKVEMSQLFAGFNNFSQTVIRDENLRGYSSGSLQIYSQWDKFLRLRDDLLMVDANLTIIDGELVNFAPVKNISKFVKIDDINDIKFKTLKNHIFIKDKQVIIPEMNISSTSLNIDASGVHNFDNHYSYKIKMLLSDLIWFKARKAKPENEEFGTVEDDGVKRTSLYLSIDGYKDDFKVKYDTKRSLEGVKQGLSEQKKELKSIFKEEFGWFKNDTTVPASNSKSAKSSKAKIEWEDADPAIAPVQQKNATKPAKVKSKDKIQVEWE
jgi:hypothetical protein